MPQFIQHTPQLKRNRTGTRKSRTGCRTCRVRHVKCDEAPFSCKKCTTTGRTCDYDLQRLPRLGRTATGTHQVPQAVASGLRWAVTTDEQRCFSYFQCHTVPTVSQLFDSPLWQELILQMSLSEPAVYHAVIAFSAVHHDSETYGSPLPGQNLQNDWHKFAVEQCGRSFSLLSQRHLSQDPRFRQVMLLCCLLFVLTQLLRGQYDDAFLHLESGMRILNEAKGQGQYDQSIQPCVVAAFTNLEVQSLQYGVKGALSADNEIEEQMRRLDEPGTYRSLHEARQALDLLLGAAFNFLGQCGGLSEEDILLDYEVLHDKQMRLFSRLGVFGDCLNLFCSRSTFNQKDQRGVDILRSVHRSLRLAIKTALIRDAAALEYYTPEYKAHLTTVEDIIDKFPERPTVTLDIGILPPLYYAAMSCRDYSVRYRAIAALRSWPHREGSFDSNWLAFIAAEQMKAESLSQPRLAQADLAQSEVPPMTDQSGPPFNPTIDRWPGIGSNFSLDDALSSTRCMKSWSCVKAVRHGIVSEVFD
ncbi:hypothetical protein BJX99DRAFT_96561 [Aspergillus californicus]